MGVKESFPEELAFELDPKEFAEAKALQAKNRAQGVRTCGCGRKVCVAGVFATKQGQTGTAAGKIWFLPSLPTSFGATCPFYPTPWPHELS